MPPKKAVPSESVPAVPLAQVGTKAPKVKKANRNRKSAWWLITFNKMEKVDDSKSFHPTSPFTMVLDYVKEHAYAYVACREEASKEHYHIAVTWKDKHGKVKEYRSDSDHVYNALKMQRPELDVSAHKDWMGCVGYVCKDGDVIDKHNVSDEFIDEAIQFYESKSETKAINELIQDTIMIAEGKLPAARGAVMQLTGCDAEDADRQLAKRGFVSKSFTCYDVYQADFKRRRMTGEQL